MNQEDILFFRILFYCTIAAIILCYFFRCRYLKKELAKQEKELEQLRNRSYSNAITFNEGLAKARAEAQELREALNSQQFPLKKELEAARSDKRILEAELQDQQQKYQRLESRFLTYYKSILDDNFIQSYIKDTAVFRDFHTSDTLKKNQRILSAVEGKMQIVAEPQITFQIKGESGSTYETTFNSCTCPDYKNRHIPCKHMYRLAIEFGQLLELSKKFDEPAFRLQLNDNICVENQLILEAKKEHEKAKKERAEAQREQEAFLQKKAELLRKIDRQLKISFSKQQTFPYLSEIFAQLEDRTIERDIHYLENKSRPAFESAAEIKQKYKKRNRQLVAENSALKNQLMFLESTFPWLEEFRQLPPEDAYTLAHNTFQASSEFEYLSPWISAEEWKKLSTVQRYQTVLDRYNDPKRKRSDWEIGRDYERYVGYQYETQGFRVQYFGATQKLEDLGRDVIASNADNTYIIQCKYWREERTVREKHIFQLYGTLIMYRLEHPEATNVQGLFVTSCTLSDTAKQVAEYLHIVVKENFRYSRDYPMIKCNISEATGEKIYHLPCDLQYDKVVIEKEKGEFYALTVAEAESAGFRRAKKFFATTT